MYHSSHYSNFLSLLIYKNKSGCSSVIYNCLTKLILENVRFLLAYNLINGYTIQRQNHYNLILTVFLKYEEGVNPVLKGIRFYSRPGCYRFLQLKKIRKLLARDTYRGLYILSTSYGILTASECLKKRIGGLLLYRVSI